MIWATSIERWEVKCVRPVSGWQFGVWSMVWILYNRSAVLWQNTVLMLSMFVKSSRPKRLL